MSSRTAAGASTSGTTSAAQPSATKPPNKLSCTNCRARKLKCNKDDPCSNCVRAGGECIFPARKRIQRPRKTKNAELLQRLHRLESIVGKVGLDIDKLESSSEQPPTSPSARELSPDHGAESMSKGPKDESAAKPAAATTDSRADGAAARYMSGEFWALLCDEVGGLKQALEHPTDSGSSDDETLTQGATPESAGGRASFSTSPGVLVGEPSNFQPPKHPLPQHIIYLTMIYFRNVDMHLKFLHRPTITKALHYLAEHPQTASDLPPEQEALFFAIYYAAITSLPAAECRDRLSHERGDLATWFQAGIERALTRADYLNNTGIEVIQALALYAGCLRSHNGSKASWSLISLPIRLAQGLNLHQDGDGSRSRFSPYEAELRRRLWWQLIVLDCRASEDRGTNTIIARGSYNTRLPHNINDDEFGPDTTTPLTDRSGPSDITFSLCTSQCSGIFLYFSHASGAGTEQSEEDTIRQAQHLESQFVASADPSHVGSYLASVLVRLIILKLWLVMRYPLHPRSGMKGGPANRDPVVLPRTSSNTVDTPSEGRTRGSSSSGWPPSRAGQLAATASPESTLRTALSIMELSEFADTGPYEDRFSWWSAMYVQWHPLAVALAELCTQTQGETVDRAWKVIESVFPRWSTTIADTKSGSLWRPIKKLYRKAKAAREAALSASGGARGVGDGKENVTKPQQKLQQPSSSSSSFPMPASSTGGLEPRMNDMAITPESSRGNAFNSPAQVTVMDDADPTLGPRLIGDYYLADPTANTLTATSTHPSIIPNNPVSGSIPATTAAMNQQGYTAQNFEVLDDAFTQSLFGWPDLNYAMTGIPSQQPQQQQQQPPPTLTTNPMAQGVSQATYNPIANAPQQHQSSTRPFYGPGQQQQMRFIDPMLDNNAMAVDWSTWDEFVLDTYNADSQSRSSESEGS